MIEFPCLLLLILVFIQWTLKCYQILYFVYVYCLSTVLFSLPSSSVHHNAFMIFHKIKASFMIDPFISRVVGPSQYFMIFHKRKGFIHDRSIYQSCSSVHHNTLWYSIKEKASFMIDPFISRVVSLLYSAFRQQHSQCICKRQCCCFDLLLIGGKYGISAAVRHEWTMGLCARTTLGMIAVVVVAVLSKTPRSRCSKTYNWLTK